ncbi:MAG TPA: hypothetical protein V6D22_04235 [Candidatus Obscuribacterales bacterium]
MSDEEQEQKQDPKEIQEFLQRLSKDKHAFGAHLGMRVEHDFDEIEKHERAKQAARRLQQKKKP